MNKKHWEELPDKGPPLVERDRQRKRGGGKKPFVIYRRYIGPKREKIGLSFFDDRRSKERFWYVFRRYKTERGCETALMKFRQEVKNAEQNPHWANQWVRNWEYTCEQNKDGQ